jgi:hypothetical protein
LELQEEFQATTRFTYAAGIRGSTDYQRALADLEVSAVTLNARIKAMPPGELAYVLETPPAGWVSIVLTPDGFDTGYDNDPYQALPLAVAEETLGHIVKQHRQAVAKGWITIRD